MLLFYYIFLDIQVKSVKLKGVMRFMPYPTLGAICNLKYV